MAEVELPYRAEYSKSARASCKTCKEKIEKDVLRLAAMVQSPMFDGKVPHWYHFKCFFVKQRPAAAGDIAHIDSLRYSDQQNIKEALEKALCGPPLKKGRGGKAAKAGSAGAAKAGSAAAAAKEANEFSVEVSPNARAGCQGCQQKIQKGENRISKMDYSSDSARQYGPMKRWHHISCFLEMRDELKWFGSAKELPGFYATPADVQDELSEKIKKTKRKAEEDTIDAAPAKKVKKEDEKLLKKQNGEIFKFRDKLKSLAKKELVDLLQHNFNISESQVVGEGLLLDRLSDYMTFGVPLPCTVCKEGLLVFKSGTGYSCTGNLTEYTHCTHVSNEPERKTFKVPVELAEEYTFLGSYKQPSLGARYFVVQGPSSGVLAAAAVKSENNGPKTQAPRKPALLGLSFVVLENSLFSKGKKAADIVKLITKLGGSTTKSITKTTAAVIATAEAIADGGKTVKRAESLGVQCVGEDFLEDAKDAKEGGALIFIKKKAISDWGEDPEKRVSSSKLYSQVHKSGKSASGKHESKYIKSQPDKMKLQLKDGGAVDPDSGLSETAHVLTYGGKLYNSVMGTVDITKGTNSYYKLQVLESDNKNAWWVFRSWGRIGTTVGSNKLEDMQDKQDAIKMFKNIYEEKTGNMFSANSFTKVPGRWTLLDIDYGDESEAVQKLTVSKTNSKLALSVQELIALIFDVDTMKSQMMEFEIDVKKLPLGKLSRRQLTAAYGVLTEAQELLQEDSKTNGPKILDCSNRFYTLIPHDFGMGNVPLLDNLELIKTKIEMVESLTEIEVAYNLLKQEAGEGTEGESAIDKHYSKLNTVIEEVDTTSEEYKVLEKYVKNTHAATHSNYELDIVNAFRIERKGEAKRFKPFKKLPNHKLLWHGSRLTNFVGILSQGLRIAPPEAPATGYMFGKGVYFADMVSKSANYCNTSHNNPTGLMMLCDVALGNAEELKQAKYITKLSGGKHSTKGCGRSCPDPAQSTILNGIEVPIGTPIDDDSMKKSTLLYNEYIVYDVSQIQTKYLLRMDFKYSSRW